MVASYQWPCWWGGARLSPTAPAVHEKLLEVRRLVGGLESVSAPGVQFKVRKATALLDKLRFALDTANCHLVAVKQDVTTIAPNTVPPTDKGKVVRSACSITTTMRFCAPDGSYLDFVGTGGGADNDDKAAGKASTYSFKDACIKAFTMPDGEVVDTDDESDVGSVPVLSEDAEAWIVDVQAADTSAALKSIVTEVQANAGLQPYEKAAIGLAVRARLGELK